MTSPIVNPRCRCRTERARRQTLVSASSYNPQGPLASLTLGNSLTETRGYITRYLPTSISVPSLLSWSYSTDSIGNPTAITDTLNSANNRTFAYQDPQYFLTTGNGPWGPRSWTYDKIGNRLTETNGSGTTTDSYTTNGTGGNTPLNAADTYDAAGDVTAGSIGAVYGGDRRMSGATSGLGFQVAYDGRGFLSNLSLHLLSHGQRNSTSPTYSSAGVLLHRNTYTVSSGTSQRG